MAATLMQRMELFGQLSRQRDRIAGALRVAFALLYRFYNGNTGRCDPGQTKLAQETGLSMRHVKRAIDELAATGWFDVQRGAGTTTRWGPTTIYAPRFEGQVEFQGVSPVSPVAPSRGDVDDTPQRPARGDMDGRQGVSPVSPRTSKRTSNRLSVHSEEVARQFETFWRSYPKRQGANPKKPAAARFEAAIKRGIDPAVILRGAENYATDVAQAGKGGTQFVAQAITWLNQERWNDHQEIQEDRRRAGMC